MIPGFDRRIFGAARVAAVCRSHPMPALVVAVLVLAAAGATGYLIHAHSGPPAAVAGTPIVNPVLAESDAKPRDTVVWRAETGTIYRAKIGGGRFGQFLRQRKEALEAARIESREWAAAEILAALKPVFADMKGRVPGYADWYFGYPTKYELMAHALAPAFDYLGRALNFYTPLDKSLIQAIGPHVVAYLEQQYTERVVRPLEVEIRLQSAFDRAYAALRARWRGIVDEQRAAMGAFIKEQAGSGERLSPEQAAGIELDWDANQARGPGMHEETIVDTRFRRGLLAVKLKIPKSMVSSSVPNAPPSPGASENAAKDSDEITHIIVTLFDKLIGPVVSQMADLAIGVFAGGAAGGTTAGFGMAGGFGMTAVPAGFASGIATAVPIGAAIGLAATVAAEMLSNRLEASLSRGEFEEDLRRNVDATENAIETGIISALHEHVEAWYGDIVNPIAVK
jgi:hypothetical protein